MEEWIANGYSVIHNTGGMDEKNGHVPYMWLKGELVEEVFDFIEQAVALRVGG